MSPNIKQNKQPASNTRLFLNRLSGKNSHLQNQHNQLNGVDYVCNMPGITTRTAHVSLHNNNVLYITMLPYVRVDEADVIENFLATRDVGNNQPHLKLVDLRSKPRMNSKTRKNIAIMESPANTIARAVLIESSFKKNLFNFLRRVIRYKLPSRFFTDEASAIIWLKTFS